MLPLSLSNAVPKRKREYLAGRLCASEALMRAGYPQPYFPAMGTDRLPVWPQGWLGSISHSGNYATAAVVRQECHLLLGIDIQQQVSEKTMHAVQYLIAKPEELSLIEGLDDSRRLTLIFSAKESLYKTLYPQVRRIQEFDAAKLVQVDVHTLTFALTRDWSDAWKAGTCIGVNYAEVSDYMFTAACIGNDVSGSLA
ncbi:4'-phosphopantetheinyl transferase superfamily protein [Dyella jejuensis]|uniref:Enterobactin synthase component D n=1 Tax=Dyella jejuensis TaxID=1432009 RepID=A0ABW8JE75_9GAMM